ncbi:hypothetical protein D3C81_1453250 [compost metagenome]
MAGGLPDGEAVVFLDVDDQGVGQQAHHARLLDPAHGLHPVAHGVEVQTDNGLIGADADGLLDRRLGLGRGAGDVNLLDLQAHARSDAVEFIGDRVGDALGPRARGQDPAQHHDARHDGDQDGARRQVQPTDRGDLARRNRSIAGALPPALRRALSPTAAHYRGHEASSTIHRTRSRYAIPT